MPLLLAVDLGLRTGLALYKRDGRLLWYRSRNFGTVARLRRGAHGLLGELPNVAWIILEGGGLLREPWEQVARRRRIQVRLISAENWRERMLYPREHRGTRKAKRSAGQLARRVIEWSGAPRATSLRHHAAEAILIGLWGVLEIGWLDDLPAEIRRRL